MTRSHRVRILVQCVMVLLGIALLTFVAIKAHVSSFTHDESYSYLHYPRMSAMDILSFKDWYTNNHILNSLFMKFSEMAFGNSELALRSPNLFALVIYLVYAARLFARVRPLLALAFFAMLCSNNLFMDFFGLARGYGLSFGFLLMGLFHGIRSLEQRSWTHLIAFHLAFLLASLSNFTLLTCYVSAVVVWNVVLLLDATPGNNMKPGFRRQLLPLATSIAVLYEPVRRLLQHGQLDFGGEEGFYADTVGTLLRNIPTMADLSGWGLIIGGITLTALVLWGPAFIIWNITRGDRSLVDRRTGLVFTSGMVILVPMIIIATHIINGTDLPKGRFALFLYPLLVLHLGFLFDHFTSASDNRTVQGGFTLLGALSLWNFASHADLQASAEWGYDMNSEQAMEELALHHQHHAPAEHDVRLGTTYLFEPTANYYRITKRLDWLLPVERADVAQTDDYWYCTPEDLAQLDTAGSRVLMDRPSRSVRAVLLRNTRNGQ